VCARTSLIDTFLDCHSGIWDAIEGACERAPWVLMTECVKQLVQMLTFAPHHAGRKRSGDQITDHPC
jgi:hypothetical protein